MPRYEWSHDDTRGVWSLRKFEGFSSTLVGFVICRGDGTWEASYWGRNDELTLNVPFDNGFDARNFVLVSARLCGM